VGTVDSVVEIGEQLAWLGSAIRSSPQEQGIMCCMPTVRLVDKVTSPHFAIAFVLSTPVPSSDSGHCWHSLFRNPTLVTGYPIPKRSSFGYGLEIPLNIMAGVAHAKRATVFNGKLFLKGFSTLLIPIKISDEMLVWHLIYKDTGGHISYLETELGQENAIASEDLVRYRHILGWCGDAKYYTGACLDFTLCLLFALFRL
jgi:hypothetical protein